MTAHVEVMDLVAQMKAAAGVRDGRRGPAPFRSPRWPPAPKAIIRPDSSIGGLDRRRLRPRGAGGATLADGSPRVSVQPENLLAELGVKPSENRNGVRFENMCPSKGTMDIFVEPVLPHPSLVILGASPVALSLAAQARTLGYHVTVAAPAADRPDKSDADMLIDGYQLGQLNEARRFIVVSTQGKGDEAALWAAAATDAAYHAFVGSRRKMAALRAKLIGEGIDAATLDRIKAPAGLDLGAITPEEIAMSILAEITVERRRGQRAAGGK
jgi:xanthine dehydrogenase accessory factor